MDNPVAKVLHDGLDRLRERGHIKHELCAPSGAVCARGALVGSSPSNLWGSYNPMASSYPTLKKADQLLSSVAREQYPNRVLSDSGNGAIVDVNNHPDTTQEDVERIFEKAIVEAYES